MVSQKTYVRAQRICPKVKIGPHIWHIVSVKPKPNKITDIFDELFWRGEAWRRDQSFRFLWPSDNPFTYFVPIFSPAEWIINEKSNSLAVFARQQHYNAKGDSKWLLRATNKSFRRGNF